MTSVLSGLLYGGIDLPDFPEAVCGEYPRDVWHDVGSVVTAKRLCGTCVERPECLAWAIEHHEPAGVWGGLTFSERAEHSARMDIQTIVWRDMLPGANDGTQLVMEFGR